jgi:hypothetical protein
MKRRSPDDPLSPLRRFARPNRKGREADLAFCRHFRARAPSDPAGSGAYWCLKTLRSEGPDGAPVAPEDCTDERTCFEAAVVEGRG